MRNLCTNIEIVGTCEETVLADGVLNYETNIRGPTLIKLYVWYDTLCVVITNEIPHLVFKFNCH